MEGDRGWCSGTIAVDVQNGQVDGTDVSGAKAILVADWPSGFLAGNGTGRMYFDAGLSGPQREALEQVLTGRRGGVFESIGSLVSSWLPAKTAPINVQQEGDKTHITVGDLGELMVEPLRGATGEPTRLLHGAASFRDDIILGRGSGTRWRDPELRQWESGGHAELSEFDWSG
jgi:hypothetical protein